jgi:hypothetical protein
MKNIIAMITGMFFLFTSCVDEKKKTKSTGSGTMFPKQILNSNMIH